MIRTLKQIVGQYWRRNAAPSLNDIDKKFVSPLNLDERLWNRLIENGGCLKCDERPKSFVEGPSGGVSTNVFCPWCGQGYNLTPLAQWAEEIHVDEAYCKAR